MCASRSEAACWEVLHAEDSDSVVADVDTAVWAAVGDWVAADWDTADWDTADWVAVTADMVVMAAVDKGIIQRQTVTLSFK